MIQRTFAALALSALLLTPATALPADPWKPAPTGGARVAIVVEGAGSGADEIEAAARDALSGADIVDAGAVRSARAFVGMGGELDDAKAERLRHELSVNRLLVVQVREEGTKRFLVVRAVEATGVVRKYAESRPGEMAGSVRDLVAQLPASSGAAPAKARSAPRTPSPASPSPGAPRATGLGPYVNLDVLLAQKQMESDDWRPVENQLELGIMGTFGGESWPIQAAGDFYRSAGSDTLQGFDEFGNPLSVDVEGTTTEIGLGVRKIFVADVFRPHVGAGLAMVSASVHAKASNGFSNSDSDSAFGPWVAAGASIRAGNNLNVGLLVRWSAANIEMNGVDADAGGLHFGITVGAGFGSAAGQR